MGDAIRHAVFYIDFTVPALRPLARDGQYGPVLEGDGGLNALEKKLDDKYLQFCDPENPLHYMAIWTARAFLAKYRLIHHYWKYSHSSVHQTEAQRDAVLSYACNMLVCDTKIISSPLTQGYQWLIHFYFPFPAYLHIALDLKRRPLGERAEQAWEAMSAHFEIRCSAIALYGLTLFEMLTNINLGSLEGPRGTVPGIRAAADATEDHIADPRGNGPTGVQGRKGRCRTARRDHGHGHRQLSSVHADGGLTAPSSSSMAWKGQDGSAATGLGAFPTANLPGQPPSDIDVNQLNWAAMDWGLGASPWLVRPVASSNCWAGCQQGP